MQTQFPEFRSLPPWWGPDLQTLRNTLAPPHVELSPYREQRLLLPLRDGTGDRLAAALQWPQVPGRRALVLLLHGLGGCEQSVYMQRSACHWLERGHPVVRLNLRGAGPSRPHCRQEYHAGRSRDLLAALRALGETLLESGVYLIGFSLGANLLVKFLAEHGSEFPIRGAMCVSTPIDLEQTAARLRAPRNRIYERYLLRKMRRDVLAHGSELTAQERRAVQSARSVYEYDERFIAPRHGFSGAGDYYTRNAARRFLDDVRVPTLLVHAVDDPWVPASMYTDYPWDANPHLQPLLTRRGGHVGFHTRDSTSAWHDRCAAIFFSRL